MYLDSVKLYSSRTFQSKNIVRLCKIAIWCGQLLTDNNVCMVGYGMTRKKVIDMHAELTDYGVIGF